MTLARSIMKEYTGKYKTGHRLFALILCFALCIVFMPSSTYAAETVTWLFTTTNPNSGMVIDVEDGVSQVSLTSEKLYCQQYVELDDFAIVQPEEGFIFQYWMVSLSDGTQIGMYETSHDIMSAFPKANQDLIISAVFGQSPSTLNTLADETKACTAANPSNEKALDASSCNLKHFNIPKALEKETSALCTTPIESENKSSNFTYLHIDSDLAEKVSIAVDRNKKTFYSGWT